MSTTQYRRLLVLGSITTFLLIIVGGVVRITGSGLGCPDWPLCHGQVIPPLRFDAWMEFSHRVVALVTSGLLLFISAVAWRRRAQDSDPWVRIPPLLLPLLLVPQALLGAIIVWYEMPADASPGVMIHLAAAMIILACMIVPAVALTLPDRSNEPPPDERSGMQARRYRRLVVATTSAAGVLLLTGGIVAGYHAIFSCYGFPDCNGALIPTRWNLGIAIQMVHRVVALVVTLLMLALLWQTWRIHRHDRAMLVTVTLAVAILIAQITVAAAIVLVWLPDFLEVTRTLHLTLATALWSTLVVLSMLALRRPAPAAATAPGERWQHTLRHETAEATPSLLADYISLTKPKVVLLLLLTTLAAMFITGAGMPSMSLVFWTMLGGYMAAGGAGAINCALEGDIDRLMGRTGLRPVPSGRIAPHHALWFGILVSGVGLLALLRFTTPLAAFLALIGLLYYVLIYTLWLKRTTWLNIVIGGAAGAIPPLVGWAAVTGGLSLPAFILFVIIFHWTPPHFWALALMKQKDYARAGVPMLPVVAGEQETRWQMLLYSILMVFLTFLLTPIQAMGPLYLVLAFLFGGIFMYYAWQVWRTGTPAHILGLYTYSLLYIALLFSAMVLDRVLFAQIV